MPKGVSLYLGPPGPNGHSDDPSYDRTRELSALSEEGWGDLGYSVIDAGYELPRDETRELVLSLHALGASYSKIHRLTGVSRRTVKRWISSRAASPDDHGSIDD